MNSSTLVQDIISGSLAAVLGALLLAGLAWLAGPLRWWAQNRAMHKLIGGGRRFRFVFNPDTQASKELTFLPDGSIGEGKNNQESSWRIRRGRVEIFAADGKVYSRFRHDRGSGLLRHTNDPDLRSIHGQYLQPKLVKVAPVAA